MATRKPPRRRTKPRAIPGMAGPPANESVAATAPGYREAPASGFGPMEDPRATAIPAGRGNTADYELSTLAQDEDLAKETERLRAIRRPLGANQQKLAYESRRGYHRHWFNDSPGRVNTATANGWAFVKGKDGQPVTVFVGSGRDGNPRNGYLMELPEQLWQEDQALQYADAQSRMDALKANPFRSRPGEAQASDKGKFYDASPGEVGPVRIERR